MCVNARASLYMCPLVPAWPDCVSAATPSHAVQRDKAMNHSGGFFFFVCCLKVLLYCVALKPRCLPPTTGSACQWWLSAGKHCWKVKKKRKKEWAEDRQQKWWKTFKNIYLSVCLCMFACVLFFFFASQSFAGRSVGSSIPPPVQGGSERRGCRQRRRWDVQAVDRDLWADSVRLQAQQQSPCPCLSARGGRDSGCQN